MVAQVSEANEEPHGKCRRKPITPVEFHRYSLPELSDRGCGHAPRMSKKKRLTG